MYLRCFSRLNLTMKTEMPEHLQYYFDTIEDASAKNKNEIQKKYEGVISHMEEIDRLLNDVSKGWKTARMNKVDLTILRLAVYEMKWDDECAGRRRYQ